MTKIEVQSVTDELAKAIQAVADAAAAMRASGLKRRAVVVLLHDMSKVSKTNIEYILNSLDQLEETYLNG